MYRSVRPPRSPMAAPCGVDTMRFRASKGPSFAGLNRRGNRVAMTCAPGSGLLQLGVVEEEHVVDPGRPVQPVADPEDVRLLVRLDDGRVLQDHLLCLEIECLPL